MSIPVWPFSLIVALQLFWPSADSVADTLERREFEGVAVARTETRLLLKLADGQVDEIPLATIGQLDMVAPGSLVQLSRTAVAPADAKAAVERAELLASEAQRAEDAASAAASEPKPTANAAKQELARAKAAAQEATAIADKARPWQAAVVGAQVVGTIEQIADDQSWIVLRSQLLPKRPWPATWEIEKLRVADVAGENTDRGVIVSIQVGIDMRTLVKSMRPGDGVQAVYRNPRGQPAAAGAAAATSTNTLIQLEWRKVPVGAPLRWASLGGTALLLLIVAAACTKGRPQRLYLGEDNRYSSSKFQTVLWFWVVTSAYLAIVLQRMLHAGAGYIGGVDIPGNLLMLSGLSVLGAAGAKLITTSKVEAAKTAAVGSPPTAPAKQPADAPAAGNLINDDFNRTDLGDFQMLTFTGIAVIIYAMSAVEFMSVIELRRTVSMPDVDATLLALFGLSQAGYLGKKAAGEVGAGLTPVQAIERAEALAATVKADVKRVQEASKTVDQQAAGAAAALAAVTAATSKAVADSEAVKALAAATAAANAQGEVALVFKTVQAQHADLLSLATTWAKDETAGPRIGLAAAAAKIDYGTAVQAAADSSTKAAKAKDAATNARNQADAK
jgi:hypothetical protein